MSENRPEEYAKKIPEFQVYLEDEEALEHERLVRRKWKRRRVVVINGIWTIVGGVAASYIASVMWSRWPL